MANEQNREKRALRKVVRFRKTEFERICERARECGIPAARYIRECAMGIPPKARRNHAEMVLVRELARVGNNLNQLAHVANLNEEIEQEEELRGVLSEVLAIIRQLGSADG